MGCGGVKMKNKKEKSIGFFFWGGGFGGQITSAQAQPVLLQLQWLNNKPLCSNAWPLRVEKRNDGNLSY